MTPEFKPFLLRLSPTAAALLDKAKVEMEKSKTAIINDAIKSYLDKSNINSRLNKIL